MFITEYGQRTHFTYVPLEVAGSFWLLNKYANFSPVCSTGKGLSLGYVWEHFLKCKRQTLEETISVSFLVPRKCQGIAKVVAKVVKGKETGASL